MKGLPIVLLGAMVFALTSAQAQLGQQMAVANSPVYEGAASPLRHAPPRQYNFSKAVLSDVMRLMAEDAGIGFFGLPDGTPGADRLVTFTLNASPFVALETLAKANGVSLIFDSGIWYLRPANDEELIGRIYEINYNAQEVVTKNSQGAGAGMGMGAPSGAGGSGGSAAGLNLQGSPDFFVTEPSRILEDIRNILDIPTTGGVATFAPTASVDTLAQVSMGGMPGVPAMVAARGAGDNGDAGGQSKVIWNSDSNTLYVVATRQQHQWIEAYLSSADRPQPMIAVEVKFIETSRDPSSNLGIDWDGALGETGLQVNLSDANSAINLDNVGSYSLPTAVLSYSDLNLKLRALYQDRNTKSVSFPRMVTLDNREVSFRSVINQPVLGSSASASLGAGATQTSSIEYLPIGTVINILPKRMAGDKILLNVSVTVSDIVGTEFINGNPFPIATSRVYTAPLTVTSGYTVAISGLDAARSEDSERGVPILGRLPVVGYAFKNRRQSRSRQHLMMLITPIALSSGTEGLTKKPVIREPWKEAPASYESYPKAPVAPYDGRPRTNADLPHRSISDVPEFHDSAAARKSQQTFGKREAIMAEPVMARSAPRYGGGSVSDTAPAPAPLVATRASAPAYPDPEPQHTPASPETVAHQAQPESGGEPSQEAPAPVLAVVAAPSGEADALAETQEKESESEPGGDESKPEGTSTMAASSPALETAGAETVSESVSESDPAPSPESTSEPSSEAASPGDEALAGLRDGVKKLRAQLEGIPGGDSRLSPDDGQTLVNVHDEASRLIERIEELRGDRSQPLQGGLGDLWWDLVRIKSDSVRTSQRSPQSLVIASE